MLDHVVEYISENFASVVNHINGTTFIAGEHPGAFVHRERVLEKTPEELECFVKSYGFPFPAIIRVVQAPEYVQLRRNDDDPEGELRYIVVAVLSDQMPAIAENYGVFYDSLVVGLETWELARISRIACEEQSLLQVRGDPEPPMIVRAGIEVYTLYFGEQAFGGSHSIREHVRGREEEEINDLLIARVLSVKQQGKGPIKRGLLEKYEQDWTANMGHSVLGGIQA